MTPKKKAISEQLRGYIEESGLSTYRIGLDAEIAPGLISRFLNRERGLRLETVDLICEVLDLELVRRGSKTAGTKNRTRGK